MSYRNFQLSICTTLAALTVWAISAPQAQATLIISPTLQNGSFEDGPTTQFSGTDNWENYRSSQALGGRNGTGATIPDGSFRGIIQSLAANLVEPSMNTGFVIQGAGTLELSFFQAGAAGWTPGSTDILVSAYFDNDGDTNDGIDTLLDSATVTPTTNANSNEPYVFSTFRLTIPASAVGETLFIRFQNTSTGNIFTAIDAVTLSVVPEPSTGLLLGIGLFGLVMRRKTRLKVEG